MISAVSSLYLFYLVSVVGISPALAGTLIFASKIVDSASGSAGTAKISSIDAPQAKLAKNM